MFVDVPRAGLSHVMELAFHWSRMSPIIMSGCNVQWPHSTKFSPLCTRKSGAERRKSNAERRNCTLGPGGPKTLCHKSSGTMVSSPWQRSLAERLQSRPYPLY